MLKIVRAALPGRTGTARVTAATRVPPECAMAALTVTLLDHRT